jgi:hypothetical protein
VAEAPSELHPISTVTTALSDDDRRALKQRAALRDAPLASARLLIYGTLAGITLA